MWSKKNEGSENVRIEEIKTGKLKKEAKRNYKHKNITFEVKNWMGKLTEMETELLN